MVDVTTAQRFSKDVDIQRLLLDVEFTRSSREMKLPEDPESMRACAETDDR